MSAEASIIPINIEDEIRHSYMDYAMSVIIGRALPDVRDGLKPVHRRILYAMNDLGNRWNSSYKKSARVVGDVIGKYHPHGDSAVYDALVRLAQDFSMRLPLVDGQGNFGSVDGDPAAAMRYTEVRMKRVTSELLSDIDRDTVDFQFNYDDTLKEPVVLPARFPNLLVNGSEGIAVGMATKIPPHNLGEILDATILLAKNPEATLEDLMVFVKGPDFPTAAFIMGRSGILSAYRTGRGRVIMRAKVEVEEIRANRQALIVTELPFQVNKARLVERVAELVRDKKVTEISDLRDESDRHGMRVVMELKQGTIPEIVLNNLYRQTSLQQTFGVNMLAIVAGQPKVLGLKEVLEYFIDFRRDVVTRRTLFLLRKAREREHLLEGLQIALDHIDAVINLIRSSPTVQAARSGLQAQFELSRVQAQAILDMRLQKLTGLERDNILAELDAVRQEIAELRLILTEESRLLEVIIEELEAVREQFTTPRLSVIVEGSHEFDPEELIAEEDMVVTISHAGYIKRTPLAEYREQKRGGKGRRGMNTRNEDFVTDVFVASTHDNLLVFTTKGRTFLLKVWGLPQASINARGKAVVNLLRFTEDESLAAVLKIGDFVDDEYLVFATRLGLVKRTRLSDYRNVNVSGIRAVGLREGDEMVNVRLVRADQDLLIGTRRGQSIRFPVNQVRSMGRTASGVKGISLVADDYVVGMEVLDHPEGLVLTVCENGYGKKTEPDEHRVQNRGGKGIRLINASERNGPVVALRQVLPTDGLILISNGGQIIRTSLSSVPVLGRSTQGVRLIRLRGEEVVVGIARVDADDEEEEELAEGEEGAEAPGEAGVDADAPSESTEEGADPSEAETADAGDADSADADEADPADAGDADSADAGETPEEDV